MFAVHQPALAQQPEDSVRQQFISSAHSYINTDEMVQQYVGIAQTHPRFQAFRKGFDAMFASDVIASGMYDAVKEAGLLEKSSTPRLVAEFIKQWTVSMGRKPYLHIR